MSCLFRKTWSNVRLLSVGILLAWICIALVAAGVISNGKSDGRFNEEDPAPGSPVTSSESLRVGTYCLSVARYRQFFKSIERRRGEISRDEGLPSDVRQQRLDAVNAELHSAMALKTLTVGLLEVFDGMIDSRASARSLRQRVLELVSEYEVATADVASRFLQHAKEQNGSSGSATTTASGDGVGLDLVDDVLQDVRDSADRLEQDMHNNQYLHGSENPRVHESLETVRKIEEIENNEAASGDWSGSAQGKQHGGRALQKIVGLVDQDNNEYVLTRPEDLTMYYEDVRLMNDIILTVVAAFALGWLFNSIGLPAFLGYIVAGCALGPAGLDIISELVQAETLSQLGVAFILFMLGLEFSIDRHKLRFAIGSASLTTITTIGIFVLLGLLFGASINEAIVVGACVSLSSTVVIHRLHSQELEPLYGPLVMQDIVFGLSLAIIPALSEPDMQMLMDVGKVFISIAVFGLLSFFLARAPSAMCLNHVKNGGNNELFLLGSVALCLVMSQASYLLGLGVEIGCFVAGMLICAHKPLVEPVIAAVEPIRDFFSCLFFASIGLHIFPSFVLREWVLLCILTMGVIGLKYFTNNMTLLLFGFDLRRASMMSIALAQISEFAFVLGSRARSFGVISREVYYLLLTITSMSLLITPVLWKFTFGGHKSGAGKCLKVHTKEDDHCSTKLI